MPLQSELLVQPWHEPELVSHTGAVPEHWPAFVTLHWPHEPFDWHAGVEPLQSESLAQP